MVESLTAADRLEILELFAKYAWTIDTADADGYATLFTPDALLRMNEDRYHGQDEIRDYVRELTSRDNWAGSQHYNGQILFEDSDDGQCRVRSYSMIVYRLRDGTCNFRHLGLYRDKCEKREGKWYFAERYWQVWDPDKLSEYRLE
jgi:hypothetical protein